MITFVRVWLFPQMKNIPPLGKIYFYSQTMLIAYAQLCENICYKKCILHTLHFRFTKYETIQFYLHVFREKTMLSYDLFPANKKLLRKMFSALLDLKKLIEYKIYFLKNARKIEYSTLIFLSP